MHNIVLQEAVETNSVKIEDIVKDIRKQMNTCKLTKYKSYDTCSKFYSSFFLSTLEGDIHPSVEEWSSIYTQLLSNDAFCGDLACLMSVWQPAIYTGIFMPLWNLIQAELAALKDNKVRYLSLTKAFITMLQMRMNGIGNMIKSQIADTNSIKFVTVVEQTLSKMVFDINALTQVELAKAVKPDDVAYVNTAYTPVSETALEIIVLFENAEEYISKKTQEYLNLDETIVSNVRDDAHDGAKSVRRVGGTVAGGVKSFAIAKKKAERNFDDTIMRKIQKLREERRNRKHSEMVNDCMRVSHELKRLIRSGAIGLVAGPVWGALAFIISIVYSRKTDRKDRAVLVAELKDELEILEEKIQMAERNGDDKEKIELIRLRQKLLREYERINKIRFDGQTRAKLYGNQM